MRLARLLQHVKTSPVPPSSLLAEAARASHATADCFQLDESFLLCSTHNSIGSSSSSSSPPATELARAFFTSPVFRLERLIIKAATRGLSTSTTDADIAAMAFDVGDCVALWRVDTRTTQEIMLRWSLAHPSGSGEVMAQGGTWLMHVTENESKNECASIRLGSFIGGGARDAHATRGERGGGHSQNSPKSDHEEDTSTERPAMSPVVLSLHTAYSKVLLAAAGANLASSLESSARSRPPPPPHIARPPAARAFSSTSTASSSPSSPPPLPPITGMAHLIINVNDWEGTTPFYRSLLAHLQFTRVSDSENENEGDGDGDGDGLGSNYENTPFLYFVGGKTAIGFHHSPEALRGQSYAQGRVGLHHWCLRARSREAVDDVQAHFDAELKGLGGTMVRVGREEVNCVEGSE